MGNCDGFRESVVKPSLGRQLDSLYQYAAGLIPSNPLPKRFEGRFLLQGVGYHTRGEVPLSSSSLSRAAPYYNDALQDTY